MIRVFAFLMASFISLADQPTDNGVRSATLLGVEDGDTCLLQIVAIQKPKLILETKIRLKDVHAYEMNKGSEQDQNIARSERTILLNALFNAKVITVQLFNRQTYDRVEGVVWADGVNLNDVMKLQPQGGR